MLGARFSILIHEAEGVDEARFSSGSFSESNHHPFGGLSVPRVHACYMNRSESAFGCQMEYGLLGFDGQDVGYYSAGFGETGAVVDECAEGECIGMACFEAGGIGVL